MSEVAKLAEVAALVGDPARANILTALLDGRAHTATELAYAAHVTAQTASGHLGRLREFGLVTSIKQGRYQLYRLASPQVARMLEAISEVAGAAPPRYVPLSRTARRLREVRTCYDHLAGRVAVALADALVDRGHIVLGADGGDVTDGGARFLDAFGIDVTALQVRKRAFCRVCIDWTERRPHLGGSLGAALLCRCMDLGWTERERDSRALRVTSRGSEGFAASFGVEAPAKATFPAAAA